jgi:hypothetical protein
VGQFERHVPQRLKPYSKQCTYRSAESAAPPKNNPKTPPKNNPKTPPKNNPKTPPKNNPKTPPKNKIKIVFFRSLWRRALSKQIQTEPLHETLTP